MIIQMRERSFLCIVVVWKVGVIFSSTCGKGETRGVQLMGGRRPHYIGNKSVINQDLEGAISRMEHLTRSLGQIYNTPSLASCPIHTEVFQKYT